MKRILLYTALGLGLTSGIAMADAITETYTFPALSGYNAENGSSFAEFNPALGTLTSITLNATAFAIFSGGGSNDSNNAEYRINLNGQLFFMHAFVSGPGNASASIDNYPESDPAVLNALTGSGSVDTNVAVRNVNGTPASISSTFGIESLTYNYTPAAVPEPGSLALLGTGLFVLGLVGFTARRRRSG